MACTLCKTVWQMPFRRNILHVLVAVLLLIAGCGDKQVPVEPQNVWVCLEATDGLALTSTQKNIFHTVGQLDTRIPPKGQKAVAKEYTYFLNKGRPTMAAFSQRAEAYLGHARQVFRSRGMPEELAFLALVESGYNPTVKSHAGAAGAWQFMPATGKQYDLRQDWWLDERLDPYKSVESAATYLQRLHGCFGDWLLAVAAYNAGEGKIGRALKGTGAKDFFTLVERNHTLDYKQQLRKETIDYVPRFLAMSKIMRNLPALGFNNVQMNNAPQHARIVARPGTDLMGMAKVVNQPWSEFKKANMSHKRYVTHAEKSTYVYVPTEYKNFASAYVSKGEASTGWKTTKVSAGETWASLSKKSNVPVAALRAANPNSSSLRQGMYVRIPNGPGVKVPTYTASAPSKPKAQSNSAVSARTYKVKPGESLLGIALKHDTTLSKLMKANNIKNAESIRIGQVLKIPGSSSVAAKTHVVKSGDTLWAIARKYDLSTKELLALNKRSENKDLRPGERLLVSSL